MSEKESEVDAIKDLKVEIFDILRNQETLRYQISQLDEVKVKKVQELQKLEKESNTKDELAEKK